MTYERLLAWYWLPTIMAWDWAIFVTQQMILAHAALHKKDSRQADKETDR